MAIIDGQRVSITAHTRCPYCEGYGHVWDFWKDEPTWCRECDSSGQVRARDERGRFVGNSKPADPILQELLAADLLDVLPRWAERNVLAGWPEDVVQRIQGGGDGNHRS